MGPVLRNSSKDARFQFIEAEQDRFGVKYLCQKLQVSTSGFYAWKARPVSKHEAYDKELLARIRVIFDATEGIPGSPKVHRQLRRDGIRVGCKRVARLMRENGLKARVMKLYRRSPGSARHFSRLPNLIVGVRTTAPGQILDADITYVKHGRVQMYLAGILDRHTRQILAWGLSTKRDQALTLWVLEDALAVQPPSPGDVFHSDRGSEYCGHAFGKRLAEANMRQSAKRPREITDNIFIESFWHSFKTEAYHGHTFTTEKQLRAAIGKFMHTYNNTRLHSSLDYKTPVEYKNEIKKAA